MVDTELTVLAREIDVRCRLHGSVVFLDFAVRSAR
jgi:hypothetical protein